MSLETINNPQQLEADWERIGYSTIFSSFAWITGFWKHGHVAGSPVYLVWKDGGRVRGIAPFSLRTKHGVPRLELAGGDYCDILTSEEDQEEFADLIREWFKDEKPAALMDLKNLHPQAMASSIGDLRAHQSYPQVDLNSFNSPGDFLSSLAKNLRIDLGYQTRRLQRECGPLRIREATEESLSTDLETLFGLHQLRWTSRGGQGLFYVDSVAEFHRGFARNMLKAGPLRLYTLAVGDADIASLYCFSHRQETTYMIGGFDPQFHKYGPSKLLISHAIQCAIQEGSTNFDFLKGEEEYKSRWGNSIRKTGRIICSNGIRGSLAKTILRKQASVKSR